MDRTTYGEPRTIGVTYEKPRVIDYGSLQELTAACFGGAGGDAAFPGGKEFGKDVNTSQIQCHSN